MTTRTNTFEASRAQVAQQTDWEARAISSSSPSLTHTLFPSVDQTIRFLSQHRENHLKVKCTIVFQFKRQPRGWKISGTGRRVASTGTSTFAIVEGILSDSGRAYWVEQHKIFANGRWQDGDERGKALVRGSFVTSNDFRGIRLCRIGAGSDYIESRYEWFKRDKVLASNRARVPRVLQELLTKSSHDEPSGVVFEQQNGGPVVIASLVPETLFGESRLAVGMPVVILDQRRVESPRQATEILQRAHGIITIVVFRDNHAFDASLASRLVSTTLYKPQASTKTGIIFRKRGDALFIGSIKEGSIAEEAGLQEFSRVWAINDQSYFETSQAAADFILNTSGYIHLVTDPTGSVDQPIDYDGDIVVPDILVEAFPVEDGDMNNSFDMLNIDDDTLVPLVPALPFDADDTNNVDMEEQQTNTDANDSNPPAVDSPFDSSPCLNPDSFPDNGGFF